MEVMGIFLIMGNAGFISSSVWTLNNRSLVKDSVHCARISIQCGA